MYRQTLLFLGEEKDDSHRENQSRFVCILNMCVLHFLFYFFRLFDFVLLIMCTYVYLFKLRDFYGCEIPMVHTQFADNLL